MIRTTLGSALSGAIASFILIGVAAPALAGSVKVQSAIPIDEGSGASQKVKDECRLQTRVPAYLQQFAEQVQLVDGEPAGGRVLELRITEVHAPGGGAYSGPKSMTVRGVLREEGRQLGSFTARRVSGGGVFGGYMGTCGIVGRCAKAIGKDISRWLEDPQTDSRLGDS